MIKNRRCMRCGKMWEVLNHVMHNLNIPLVYKDWDSCGGDLKVCVLRKVWKKQITTVKKQDVLLSREKPCHYIVSSLK